MKRFIGFVMALFIGMAAMSCVEASDTGNNGSDYLDVTPNNISGVWRMESYDNGVALEEGSYYYLELIRKDKKFVIYDNLESMNSRKRTGRFDIETNSAAVIFGVFDNDFGLGDWEHRYYVRDLTEERMVWVATDDEEIVMVFVRSELPEEWQEK